MAPKIRSAVEADLSRVTEIYNHYVVKTPITFDTQPFTSEERLAWFDSFKDSGPHRLLVALDGDRVCGYAGSMQFRSKPAYRTSVETTVYVDPEACGSGIGSALYRALFDALRHEELNRALAGITLPNAASIALHERFDFTHVGVFSEVGYKRGRYWDVLWMEKRLEGRRGD